MRIPLLLLSALALAAALPAPALAQDVPFVPIGGVQGPVADGDTGTAHRSPLAPPSGNGSSSAFVTTRGVVRQRIVTRTAAGEPNYGFFLQSTDLTADEDPLSSDGIFVFMGRFTTLIGGYEPRVGDEIVVRARVAEFFNLTELTSASLVDLVRSEVDLEAEVPATELDPPDDLAAAGRYWERREGMFASVPAGALAISGRDVFASTLDGEAWVIRGDHPLAERRRAYERRSFRDAHPLDNHPRPLFDDGNGYRILLGSLGLKGATGDSAALIDPVRTFDRIRRPVAGGVYYGFGKYSVQIGEQPARAAGANPARNVPPRAPSPREYSVANYNVENLYDFRDDPGDGCDFTGNSGCEGVSPPFDYVPASLEQYEAKLADQAQQIARDLKRPDIVLVQEAEDQDLCRPVGDELACDGGDGRPDTLQELAQAIRLRFGVAYAAASDRDGADDRGIVSGFLYRTGRVRLEEATAGDPVLGSSPAVDYRAPGLGYNTQTENPKVLNAELPADVDRSTGIDGDAVFTRPPQVARFRVWRDRVGRGSSQELVAISNHFSSTPDGRVGQRTEQARYGAAIVNALGGRARVVFGGDLNVFPRPDDPFSPGQELFPSEQLAALYDDARLTNLFDRLVREVPASAYTYVFQGQAQTLDHQFVSRRLARDLREVRVAHINADWPKDHDGDEARGASDHDPVVSRYRFAPAAADATRRAQPVTVMTYNIHHAQGADDVLDLERVASVVRDQRVDVVGLQEVDRHWSERSEFADQAGELARTLGMNVVYGANLDLDPPAAGAPRRQYGTAILSRHPILESENTLLPRLGSTEQRGLLEALIDVRGTRYRFYNTHLQHNSPDEAGGVANRTAQVEAILAETGEHDMPQTLVGDINARPDSQEIQPLYTRFLDAWALVGAGDGFTISSTAPSARIDYILSTPDIRARRARVPPTIASDHLPVVARLRLPGRRRW